MPKLSILGALHHPMIFVMVQLNKVEVHELKPEVLTKDEGGLVWRQTRQLSDKGSLYLFREMKALCCLRATGN